MSRECTDGKFISKIFQELSNCTRIAMPAASSCISFLTLEVRGCISLPPQPHTKEVVEMINTIPSVIQFVENVSPYYSPTLCFNEIKNILLVD